MKKYSLLIDGDNIHTDSLDTVMSICDEIGELYEKKIFCNSQTLNDIKKIEISESLGIEIIEVETTSKGNNVDNELMMYAAENFSNNDISGFVIASGDGDFSSLVNKINSKGKEAIGIGHKNITGKEYADIFTKFHYIEEFVLPFTTDINMLKEVANEVLGEYPIITQKHFLDEFKIKCGELLINSLITDCDDFLESIDDVSIKEGLIISKKLPVEKKSTTKSETLCLDEVDKKKTFKTESKFLEFLNKTVKQNKGLLISDFIKYIENNCQNIAYYTRDLETYIRVAFSVVNDVVGSLKHTNPIKALQIVKAKMEDTVVEEDTNTTEESILDEEILTEEVSTIEEEQSNLEEVDYIIEEDTDVIVSDIDITDDKEESFEEMLEKEMTSDEIIVNDLIFDIVSGKSKMLVSRLKEELVKKYDRRKIEKVTGKKFLDYLHTIPFLCIWVSDDKKTNYCRVKS